MKNFVRRVKWTDFIWFTLGTAIYAIAFVNINMPAKLAEGGVAGLTLIIKNLVGINPALSTLLINIPLMIIGFRVLGRKSLIYTIYGVLSMSFWIWIAQFHTFDLGISNDPLIAAIMAGTLSGLGNGLVYRHGGTTGGTDIIAKIIEQKFSVPMGTSLFTMDALILFASLSYIDVRHMMYTLISAFVFANVANVVQTSGYSARALMVMTSKPDEIADSIMKNLDRGVTFLDSHGAYTGQARKTVYTVIDPSEMNTARAIIDSLDDKAFISITNVGEQIGEGFTTLRKKRKLFENKKNAISE
ncbi:MAG: YitT family protein [Lactobacillaceae bacterium]|nr:YitT family protein [Lactobacillaceae bacterium]